MKVQQLGCAIPQHADNSEGLSAIRGEFAERRRADWAVLCRRGTATTLIVFWTGSEAGWWELWETIEGDGVRLVGRPIMPVGRTYILEHCQPIDGVFPPIDHQGILDGFNGSVVHYYYKGNGFISRGSSKGGRWEGHFEICP